MSPLQVRGGTIHPSSTLTAVSFNGVAGGVGVYPSCLRARGYTLDKSPSHPAHSSAQGAEVSWCLKDANFMFMKVSGHLKRPLSLRILEGLASVDGCQLKNSLSRTNPYTPLPCLPLIPPSLCVLIGFQLSVFLAVLHSYITLSFQSNDTKANFIPTSRSV